MNVADIAALAAIAREAHALLIIDNTFASPALQLPISLGADIVLHSTTKYLGGHSDVQGGVGGGTNLNTDPKFVGAIYGDLHPCDSSPVISMKSMSNCSSADC